MFIEILFFYKNDIKIEIMNTVMYGYDIKSGKKILPL